MPRTTEQEAALDRLAEVAGGGQKGRQVAENVVDIFTRIVSAEAQRTASQPSSAKPAGQSESLSLK